MKCGHLDIPAKVRKGGWINESLVYYCMPLHKDVYIAYRVLFNACMDRPIDKPVLYDLV